MAIPGVGRMTAAELLEVKDGQKTVSPSTNCLIVRGELIYDAEELRRAMAAANSKATTE
jgi:broad-specificity NMP kinase